MGLPKLEEIDVMRLTADRPYAGPNRIRAYRLEAESSYDAPVEIERPRLIADLMIAGWTEMVIQGTYNDNDPHVFLIAGTSRENAPEGCRLRRLNRIDTSVGISHQAIKR
jgi:hypothetical protein